MALRTALLRSVAPALRREVTCERCLRLNALPARPGSRLFKRTATSAEAASAIQYQTAESRAEELQSEGSDLLSAGDAEAALKAYDESLQLHETATGFFNKGVALYSSGRREEALLAWERSIELGPSADCHNNLATALMLRKPPQPEKALEHYRRAIELDPADAQIHFNLGAVLESLNQLQASLDEYKKAKEMGVERADQNLRNVGAKILRQRIDAEGK